MVKTKLKPKIKSQKKKIPKYIYFFGGCKAEGNGTMKELLGGKGAGLAEMTNAGAPVPAGFTITTEVCRFFYAHNNTLPKGLENEILKYLNKIEKEMGSKFGDKENPLLVSVRSGAKFSMPGMMDTVLNLGLNDETVEGLAQKTNDRRFAYDCYRRFIQMFGKVVLGIDAHLFEEVISKIKSENNVTLDTELKAEDWKKVIDEFKKIIQKETGNPFPSDCITQLKMAINAVFNSWMNPRAVTYRKLNNIPHDLGTAVNVQAMVFGNRGDDSGTGVGFTRNPATGEKEFFGEYLTNAQGEDVVAGIRTPKAIAELEKDMPKVYKELKSITIKMERHYRDIQDFEFTIEKGKLYMLQTRNGKRTGHAAVKIAVDMVNEKIITKQEAIMMVEPQALDQLLHPIFDIKERGKFKVIAKGLNASPGAAAGMIVFTADDAVLWANQNKKVILVRSETCPDDIHGMSVAQGVLTATGGMTSHAAVVGRQMGKPSVVGCSALKIDEKNKTINIDGLVLKEGDFVSIDGTTGEVMLGNVPTRESEILQVINGQIKKEDSKIYQYFEQLLKWADEIRRLGVRANADIPRDAKLAFAFGGEGIGLCRTEHMFFAEDRLPIMQKMIMAKTKEERERELEKLLPMQRADFKGLFKEMRGYPVTIRLLDPPLHEFLPKREELIAEITKLELSSAAPTLLNEKKAILQRVQDLHEFNPMLGMRGCRLGIMMPEISEMQIKAIFLAAADVVKEGREVRPEIMVPLTSHVNEMKIAKKQVDEIAKDIMEKEGVKIDYFVGTMIELPRAAITADEVAKEAEFFSFGTNDLTQTTFGISRDDAVRVIQHYQVINIFEQDPFQTLDTAGVGALIQISVEKGRKTRPDLKIGICGEHGGDPASVKFCHKTGLDYVSCSPYRIPIARLAAAQAVLEEKIKKVGD